MPADAAAEREVVAAAAEKALGRPRVRLVARERRQGIGEPGDAAGEGQARRPPVHRFLVVAGDARLARHVGAVGKVRRRLVGRARELIAQAQREELREPVRPVDRGIDAGRARHILEAEQVRRLGRRPLVGERAGQLIARVDRLRRARLHVVLPGRAQDGVW